MIDNYHTCPDIVECLEQLEINEELAVAVSRQHAMNNRKVANWKIHCFSGRNTINSYPVTMLIKEDISPMTNRINMIIQSLVEGGFLDKWATDSRINGERPTQCEINLEVKHIMFAIILFVCFASLSIVAFFVEIFIHQKLKKNQHAIVWQYAQRIVDGKRYLLLPEKQEHSAVEIAT